MPRLALILIVAGLSAAVFSQLGAALCGAISWRWPDRAVAATVAVLLAVGTAFVLWWLLAPPHELFDLAGEPVAYAWWLWVAAAALAVATVAAAALARRAP